MLCPLTLGTLGKFVNKKSEQIQVGTVLLPSNSLASGSGLKMVKGVKKNIKLKIFGYKTVDGKIRMKKFLDLGIETFANKTDKEIR